MLLIIAVQGLAFLIQWWIVVAVKTSGHLNIKTKMFVFEACVLIGWLANTLRESANQNACLKVKQFCSYAKVTCLSYDEYSLRAKMCSANYPKVLSFITFTSLKIGIIIKYQKIFNYLKIRLYLKWINQGNEYEFGLKITNKYQNNHICLKYLENNIWFYKIKNIFVKIIQYF